MATYRINFTKAALERITPPTVETEKKGKGGVSDTYHDTKEKGLILLVSNGGAKTYYLYTKINGKPERIKLGAFTDLSIEQARKRALEYRGNIALGNNPQDVKRAIRQEMTFQELCAEFMERHSKPNKNTWKEDERIIGKYLPPWFSKKISAITKQDIQKLHQQMKDKNGATQANRVFERVRAMYNKAIEWGWKGDNPCKGIKKYKERKRDRFLQPYELPYFFEALEAEQLNTGMRDYIHLSLLTGARKSNVLAMRWDQVSFELGQWRIPETKNGESHTVALSSAALEILKDRKEASQSAWVFPSDKSRSGHLMDPKKAWRRLILRASIYQHLDIIAGVENWKEKAIIDAKQEAEQNLQATLVKLKQKAENMNLETSCLGLPEITLHDLRRSLGSWQAVTGASLPVIGKTLGHKTAEATSIYARLNLDPVREAVETATQAMLQAGRR